MGRDRRSQVSVVAAVCVLALIGTSTTAASTKAAAAGLPDLVVSTVTTHITNVVRGHPFQVASTTKNAGSAAAGASTTRFYLSVDRVRGVGDLRLAEVRHVATLQPGKSSSGASTLRPPATTPAGFYWIIACADDLKAVGEKSETNNCRTSATAAGVVPGRSTIEQIDQDLADGLISPEDATLYRVYAAFGDSRLPAKYHGDDASVVDFTEAAQAAATGFDTASASAKTALIPFLTPPAYPSTWEESSTAGTARRTASANTATAVDRRFRLAVGRHRDDLPHPHPSTLGEPGWSYYQHPDGMRVWFHPASQQESLVAQWLYLSYGEVYDKLTALMAHVPGSDAGPHPFVDGSGHTGDWGDGGSPDLDIYLAPIPDPALTIGYPPKCTDTASYVLFNNDEYLFREPEKVRAVLAHEFMHVLQNRYTYSDSCGEYRNLDEAAAQWAIDYVDPHVDVEHASDHFLPFPDQALNDQGYDGWPFEMFLAHTVGPGAIPQIWSHTESEGPWDAVNDGIPGGLKQQWPAFALKAWNQAPITSNSFKQWDELPDVPPVEEETDMALDGAHKQEQTILLTLPALTRNYQVVTVNKDVGRLEFRNDLFGVQGAAVQALIQLRNGTWKDPQDWTQKQKVAFCTSKPAEAVQKIVLVMSNSTFDDPASRIQGSPKLVATADCLPETYTGTFSGTDEIFAGGLSGTFSGSATLKRASVGCGKSTCYKLVSGSMTWQWGTLPGSECTYHSDPRITPLAVASIDVERTKGPDGKQTYDIGFHPQNDTAPGTVDCGDGPGDTTFNPPTCCVLDPNKPPPVAAQDGWLLNGSAILSIPDIEEFHSSWSFRGHGPP